MLLLISALSGITILPEFFCKEVNELLFWNCHKAFVVLSFWGEIGSSAECISKDIPARCFMT
jgi:hypothetical protein